MNLHLVIDLSNRKTGNYSYEYIIGVYKISRRATGVCTVSHRYGKFLATPKGIHLMRLSREITNAGSLSGLSANPATSAFFIIVQAPATRDLDGTFGLRGDHLRDRTQ